MSAFELGAVIAGAVIFGLLTWSLGRLRSRGDISLKSRKNLEISFDKIIPDDRDAAEISFDKDIPDGRP